MVHGKYTLLGLMQRIRRLTSVTQIVDVIEADRGRGQFRHFIGRNTSKQSIYNYKAANSLPPWTFLIVTHELARLSCSAPPLLWGIEPVRARAA